MGMNYIKQLSGIMNFNVLEKSGLSEKTHWLLHVAH